MTHVFMDSCSYTYWRVTATMAWWRRYDGSPPSLENETFMGHLERQYLKGLDKINKATGGKTSDIILVRDCPIEEIWRKDYLPSYKANRSTNPSTVGPFIKHLNSKMKSRYAHVFRIERTEADDVIATLARFYVSKGDSVVIVANDSDYHQLMRHTGIRVFNPKAGDYIKDIDPIRSLVDKLRKGDSSDNVPASSPQHLKRLLIDLTCIPRNVQDDIITIYRDITSKKTDFGFFTPMDIQLGLCCMNTKLRGRNIFCSRTMRLDTIEKKGIEELKRRALQNCCDLIKHLEWNAANGIRVFRISSDLFPHMNNPKAPSYTLDFAKDILQRAGQYARDTNQRLTFHPGQYNVVGTPHDDKFQKTVGELDWHAHVLDIMGCGPDSVMVVHGGGTYGNKAETIRRWIKNFSRLPERVQRRLVLENCEKSFSVADCLAISDACGVPVVLDTHHFECYKLLHPKEPIEDIAHYIPQVLETWKRRNIKPKFHVSQQREGKQIGAHSDLITELPQCLLDIPRLYNTRIDIMIEAKLKEQAIEGLYMRHPELRPTGLVTDHTRTKVKARARVRSRIKVLVRLRARTMDE